MQSLQNQTDNFFTSQEYVSVILDSRNATTYYNDSMNSSIVFNFEEGIRMPPSAISLSISILNFTCPISFYQINSSNNLIILKVFGISNFIRFPNGNYNVNTFMSYFNSIAPAGIQISINLDNNTFLLQCSSYFQIEPLSTLFNVMGFKKNTLYSSDSTINSKYIIRSPFCCNFSGINSFNIKVSNISTKNINSFDNCVSSIIATVPVNGQQNNMIFYNKLHDYDFVVNTHILDYLQIDIQDDLDNYIDFNNQNWNMTILFKSMYNNKIKNKENFYDITGTILGHPNLEI